MKRILILLMLLIPFQSYGANITLDIKVINEKGEKVKNFIINQASGVGDYKYLVTDENGSASSSFEYDTDGTNPLTLELNGNQIILNEVDGSQKELKITYNEEEQKIEDVFFNGIMKIKNQEVTKSTNYYLLITYFFLTLILGTVIVLSRVFYMKAQIDIIKHNQLKKYI